MNDKPMTPRCPWCAGHHIALCPRISAVEYREDGRTPHKLYFFPVRIDEPDAQPEAEKPTRPETDAELRNRIMLAIGANTVNQKRALNDTGDDLDELASFYGMKREKVPL